MNLRKYPMDTQKCVLHIMSCKLIALHCIAWFISNYGFYLRDYQNVYEFGSIKEFCVIVIFLTSSRFLLGGRCQVHLEARSREVRGNFH